MNALLKSFALASVVAAFAGCLFDGGTQVAGGEDFPNTITPLGKVTSENINAFSNWDQFQGIDTTPDLSTDSLTQVLILAKSEAAKVAATSRAFGDTTVTSIQQGPGGILTVRRIRVNRTDKVVEEYDVLRTLNGGKDTVEWTRLLDADNDKNLWDIGDSGVVELRRQIGKPPARPDVSRLWSTLKVRILQRGKLSMPLSYSDSCIFFNGDTTVSAIKGIRGADSLMMQGDTSLVAFDRMPSGADSLLYSKARYWVRLGKLVRSPAGADRHFPDNALLRFEIKNRRKSGVIRYDSTAFTPDSAVLSGRLGIRGSFVVSATNETGSVKSQLAGTFRNDSIRANMRETRDGNVRDYHMVYDDRGEVQKQDTLHVDFNDPAAQWKPASK